MRWWLACALIFGCEDRSGPADLPPDLALCNDSDPPDGGVCPAQVHGRVVGENGAPLAALTVSVCADQCFFGSTLSDGSFTVIADQHIVLANYALELHGRPDRVTYYTPLAPAAGLSVQFQEPLLLPLLPARGPEILKDMSAQTLTSGDLTLTLAAGTMIVFDVEDFGFANGHQLRVQKLDPAQFPFVDNHPDALYACSPFEVWFSQPASLGFANSAALPAGSAVEILQLRGLVNDGLPAGHFMHAANAHVSADGTSITTDPGEGVTELTWLAVKRM
jgi:hypothetical protein